MTFKCVLRRLVTKYNPHARFTNVYTIIIAVINFILNIFFLILGQKLWCFVFVFWLLGEGFFLYFYGFFKNVMLRSEQFDC
jgi:hypothetical protein